MFHPLCYGNVSMLADQPRRHVTIWINPVTEDESLLHFHLLASEALERTNQTQGTFPRTKLFRSAFSVNLRFPFNGERTPSLPQPAQPTRSPIQATPLPTRLKQDLAFTMDQAKQGVQDLVRVHRARSLICSHDQTNIPGDIHQVS